MSNDLSEAARAMGRKGGASTSPAKQAASRANGAKAHKPTKGEVLDAVAKAAAKPTPELEVPALAWDELDQS